MSSEERTYETTVSLGGSRRIPAAIRYSLDGDHVEVRAVTVLGVRLPPIAETFVSEDGVLLAMIRAHDERRRVRPR